MKAPDFDWMNTPLQGMQLIEASAGTGKTWTLTMIYLRLLLETSLSVDNILVVTFTQAATSELKARLRETLSQTWTILNQATSPSDPVSLNIYQRYRDNPYLLRKLYSAIRHFDRASIYTIHGFCQRVLMDHAFRLGGAFERELNKNDQTLLRQAIDHFWRQEIAESEGLWPRFLYQEGISPKTWFTEINALLGKGHYSQILLPEKPDIATLEKVYLEAYEQARIVWQNESQTIENAILASKLGYRKTYFAALNRIFIDTQPDLLEKDKTGLTPIARFSANYLQRTALEKNKPIPSHLFFEAIDTLLVAYDNLWAGFIAKKAITVAQLLTHCETALPLVAAQRQEMSYDDLLHQLDLALQKDAQRSSHSGQLAQVLQNRFSAALIDEFQDTDPIQYRIFSRIYQDKQCPVFLIGDPKQAIYSFRGADIFTYLAALKETEHQWTLRVNYRSTEAVLESVNALFSLSKTPFCLPQIDYVPVTASERVFAQFDDPLGTDALRCWQLVPRDNQPYLSKEAAIEAVLAALGTEIQHLLHRVKIGEKLVQAGDIAILVPSHYYASQVLTYLNKVGVPATRVGMESIFASQEAQEWRQIMQAFLEPQRESLRKAALATIYMGVDAQALLNLTKDEAAWDAIAEQFTHYHRLWQQYGITRAFYTWLHDWQVGQRLVRLAEGERRLSNLLHLIEILQQKSQTLTQLSLLFDWFVETLKAPDGEDEESQLRLESDTARIKIMTIHAAKGLEFPIIFCPFLWHIVSSRMGPLTAIFHDEQGQNSLDFGSNDYPLHEKEASLEAFAEKLRVLYVALTRARYRTYLSWGKVRGIEKTPLAWLLYSLSLAQEKGSLHDLSEEAFWAPWQLLPQTRVQTLPLDASRISALPTVNLPNLRCAEWQRSPHLRTKMMTSFSALTQNAYVLGSENEWVNLQASSTDVIEREGIAAFPAGARTGLCWHSILEQWDFVSVEQLKRLITHYVEMYGFLPSWQNTLVEMFTALSEVRFNKKMLKEVNANHRLSELAFTFRLSAFTYQEMVQILRKVGETDWAEASEKLQFDAADGFMTGFIDLVLEVNGKYFIVDYKSNRLGDDVEAYQAETLKEAMASHHYYLQYLLYSVAVHRYLRRRKPDYDYETHFGGVVYIFMRGLVRDSESGIFRDRPSKALIEALDQLFDRTE